MLDFTRPVAVLLLAVLHFLADADGAASIIKQFAAALAPGSLIAISHLTGDYAPEQVAEGTAAYNARVPIAVHPRTREQLTSICGAVPIQHPGVVQVNFWSPSLRESPGPAVDLHAAVLRLPLPAHITTAGPAPPLTRPQPSPQEQAAGLERTAARHPAYEITTDLTAGRLRYVARARTLTTHPYLVIASTLGELAAELSSAQA